MLSTFMKKTYSFAGVPDEHNMYHEIGIASLQAVKFGWPNGPERLDE